MADPFQAALPGSFTVLRELGAPPDRVYAAYGDPAVRRQWFRMPGDEAQSRHELDFRVGGQERSTGVFAPDGATEERMEYRSVFWDLVPGARLVFGYGFALDGVRRWTSLVTVSLTGRDGGQGTLLRHTEQYVFLAYEADGSGDVAHLQGSTNLALNALAAALDATG